MSRLGDWLLVLCLAGVLSACGGLAPPPEGAAAQPAGVDEQNLGRGIYRAGRLASGAPLQAEVAAGVPIAGANTACINCHRRSGMGGSEGDKIVLPINGPALFTAREHLYHERPAYTEASLSATLRSGVDPAGNRLDPLMPRYRLSETEMSGLTAYMRQLSREPSAGVTPTEIHLATVIDMRVEDHSRSAMLEVIEQFFRDKNGGTRAEERRRAAGPFYHEYRNKAYRTWVLHRWELTGPESSWPAQLETYYRQQPVFALVSGLAEGEWRPVQKFCEERQIPQLLPNTDLPTLDDLGNDYTLYFSKGLALEAEVILARQAESAPQGQIVQYFAADGAGAYAARALRRAAAAYPGISIENRSLLDWAADRTAPPTPGDASVLWARRSQLEHLAPKTPAQRGRLYLSSSLLGSGAAEHFRRFGAQTFLVHPYVLPSEQQRAFRRVEVWLKAHQIPQQDLRIQGQTFYACMLLGDLLSHIRLYFYRDYLLDLMEHSDPMAGYSSNYPRLSFAPGQRYLAKGAYLLDISNAQSDAAAPATWIVPGARR